MDLRKINRGVILTDFPQICIDKFSSIGERDSETAFFLTHYDDDILAELLNGQFFEHLADDINGHALYLHRIVFSLLKYWTSTHLYDNYKMDGEQMNEKLDQLVGNGSIILLEANSPVHLVFDDSQHGSKIIDVTPLSSGSNAGCIMLLIETGQQRVLYTGTCRLVLRDLQNCQALHNSYDGTVKKIDKIHLDTTYCLDTTKELPARSVVVNALTNQLAKEFELKDQKQYEFSTPREMKISNLFCLAKLAELTQQQIHVPFDLACFLKTFNCFQNLVGDEANSKTKIHYDCAEACDYEECFPFAKNFLEHHEISSIKVGCSISCKFGYRRVNPPTIDEMQWSFGKKCVYTTHLADAPSIHGIYSNHLSFYEMGRMLNYLNVDPYNVLPLFERNDFSMDEIEIALDTACNDTKSLEEPFGVVEQLSSCNFDFTSTKSLQVI